MKNKFKYALAIPIYFKIMMWTFPDNLKMADTINSILLIVLAVLALVEWRKESQK